LRILNIGVRSGGGYFAGQYEQEKTAQEQIEILIAFHNVTFHGWSVSFNIQVLPR